jgi:hypothetical protein
VVELEFEQLPGGFDVPVHDPVAALVEVAWKEYGQECIDAGTQLGRLEDDRVASSDGTGKGDQGKS